MKRKTMRELFEASWTRTHQWRNNPQACKWWLRRDDIWGKGGYAQPSVHYEWLAFRAGWRASSCGNRE